MPLKPEKLHLSLQFLPVAEMFHTALELQCHNDTAHALLSVSHVPDS
jgi:hypothetical protein